MRAERLAPGEYVLTEGPYEWRVKAMPKRNRESHWRAVRHDERGHQWILDATSLHAIRAKVRAGEPGERGGRVATR